MKKEFKFTHFAMAVAGALIMAFGLFEIHSPSNITEGGVLGLTLLLDEHFSLSPSISSLIINALCYLIGFKILGKSFLVMSAVATISFSIFYKLLEFTEPILKNITDYPLAAALLGAIFIGVGAGLCVRAGGAPTGDDALAMGFSEKFKVKIETVYLISDISVLLLSLSYIPLKRIIFSIITVVLSGQIIGYIQRYGKK